MANFKPTPAQQQAIDSRGKDILVSASAGSGKTAVLVNRVIQLVKEGKDISKMLLVTFTDAAAKNMRDKIRQALQKEAHNPHGDKKYHERMQKQVNLLAVADISTIHAFCLHLIKRYYYLIDLDPQFRLLTDETEQLLLKEEVWEQVSARYYALVNEGKEGEFDRLVKNFAGDRDDQGLDDLVLKLYETANAQSDPQVWLKQLPDQYELGDDILRSSFFTKGIAPIISARLAQLQQDIKEGIILAQNSDLDKDQDSLKKDQQIILQLQQVLTNSDQGLIQALQDVSFPDFKGRLSTEIQEKCAALKADWERFVAEILADPATLDRKQVHAKIMELSQAFLACQTAPTGEKAPTKKAQAYLETCAKQLLALEELTQSRSWNQIKATFSNVKLASTPRKPKDTDYPENHETIKEIRKNSNDAIKDITTSFFAYDEEELRRHSKSAQRVLQKLSEVTNEFYQQYQQTKESRHILEFSDLEHKALAILTPAPDQPDWQSLVKNLRQHYQEIMVDEYQDTNPLQESILMKLTDSHSHKLFMVGDVKQSIYRFREADPSLFLNKYHQYRHHNKDGEQAIVLGENFRSMKGITDFTNLVFKQVMDQNVGEINYDHDAELKYAAKYYDENPANQSQPAEVMLYIANSATDPSSPNYEDNKLAGELRMVGAKIKQLVATGQLYDQKTQQMRPIHYDDIVILERTKTINNNLVEEFSKLNIPLTVHDVESYFQTIEVRVMMSILKIIDNPRQDIPLVAVLRSPMVGLSNQELAFIRLQNKSIDYYGALKTFIYNYQHQYKLRAVDENLLLTDTDLKRVHNDPAQKRQLNQQKLIALYKKLARFLDQLTRFRNTARQQTLVDLIWQIYNETGYLDYVGTMRGGQQRQANLHALYQRAQIYEESSFKGLYQFIRFIEKMQAHDKDLGIAPTQLSANTVNVMTIHSSKGLQFPIVFLVDTTRGFNSRASRGNAIVDSNAGVGIKVLDQEEVTGQLVRYDTPQQKIITERIKHSERAEDMRILYVALTRAEQRLFITGSFNEAQRQNRLETAWTRWQKAYQSPTSQLTLSPQLRLTAGSFMDWIGLALTRYAGKENGLASQNLSIQNVTLNDSPLEGANSFAPSRKFIVNDYDEAKVLAMLKKIPGQTLTPVEVQKDQLVIPIDNNKIRQILEYQYPYRTATHTTAYQSVTDVKRIFEDDDPRMAQRDYTLPEDFHEQKRKGRATDFATPPFIQQEAAATSPQATQVGTATHLVFQKLPLIKGQIERTNVEATLKQLVTEHLISPLVAQQVDCAGISAFFETEVGQQILQNPTAYHREEPFAMVMNAHEPFARIQAKDNYQVLIHGIIDGYLETQQGVILVDYKTDHVTPKNINKIIQKYSGQLKLYAEALNIMKPVPVVQMGLYLLELKKFVSIHGGGNESGNH